MHRETLEDTRRSPFAEKYMSIVLAISLSAETHNRIVLALEGRDGPNSHDKAGRLMAQVCPGRCSNWRASGSSTSDLITLTLRSPCRLPLSLLGAGPGFRHEHQGPFSSFESQRFGQGWNLESRGVSVFCANAWFDSGYMSHGGRRPPIVHLVLLKRSLANHPTHSGPSDNPPGRSPSAPVHCVGPGEHSGPSSASHGEDWSPPRGHDHWL